jgi:hypothetical protein
MAEDAEVGYVDQPRANSTRPISCFICPQLATAKWRVALLVHGTQSQSPSLANSPSTSNMTILCAYFLYRILYRGRSK